MKISIDELRAATRVILGHFEASGQSVFEIDDDFYWHVPDDQRYDPYTEPTKLTLGQLSDDMAEIKRIASGESAPTGLALAWLASIFRRIGEGPKGC